MLNLLKSNQILLAFTSIALIESTAAFNCPSLNKDQISTVCLSQTAEYIGVKAKEIEVDGVRFVNNNNKNCNTLTSAAAKIKLGSEKIAGTFVETARIPHKTHEGDFLEISGKCTYNVPKLLSGHQAIEFEVKAQQKVIRGIRVSPLAEKTSPKIGSEKVDNPEHHKPKPTFKEMVFGKQGELEETAEKPQSPAYQQELKERQEGQAPRVVQHGTMPEPMMDYKRALPKAKSPKPATKEEIEMLERMQEYKEEGPIKVSPQHSIPGRQDTPVAVPDRPTGPLPRVDLNELRRRPKPTKPLPRPATDEREPITADQPSSRMTDRPQPPIQKKIRPLPQPPVMPGSEGSD